MSLYHDQHINSPSDTIFKYQTKRPITLINTFPCGIIFDETNVNPNQASLLASVVKELRKRGFSPSNWRGSFTADVKAPYTSRRGVSENLFNILLLDGFSPNLLYKYGLLKGEGQPVILLLSKNASIPVKSLYSSVEDSGLAANLFNNHFLEPIIDLPFLLNGLATDQLGIIDLKAISSEPSHPNLSLKEIFAKTGGFFTDILKKRLTQQFPDECLNEINPLLEIFCEFYRASSTGNRFSKMNQLRTVYASLQEPAEHYRFTIPYEFAKLLICSFVFQGTQNPWDEPAEKESYLRLALAISRDLHNTTEDPYRRAYLAKEIGAIGAELFLRDGSVESLQTAEQALDEALEFYKIDNYPVEFGMIHNNQGVVHLGKAIYFDCGEELQLASTAFKNAQAVLKDSFLTQHQYQITEFNLGLTLARQGELNSNPELLHQALNQYDAAVNITGAEPLFLAQIHQNRGDLYQELAATEPKLDFHQNTVQSFQKALELGVSSFGSEETEIAWRGIGEAALKMAEHQKPDTNLKLAINAYMQFFKVHQDTCSLEWGKAGKNLADAYFSLANYETNMVHYHSAVSIYLESLRVLTADSFPEDFIAIQKNLAIIYRILAQDGNSAENYHKAINAWREVLRLTPSEDLLQQAKGNLELAKLYSDLSLIEQSEQHNQAAGNSYQTVVELTASKLDNQNCLELYLRSGN